jgi:hypothetical protein
MNDSNVWQQPKRDIELDTENLFELVIARKRPIRVHQRKTGDDEHVFLIDLALLASNLASPYKLHMIAANIMGFVESSQQGQGSLLERHNITRCYMDYIIKAITRGDQEQLAVTASGYSLTKG